MQEGKKAPAFTLEGSDGKKHKLSDYKGRKVILYFYPRDNTPGCTKEACEFNEAKAELKFKNTIVLGVSKDSLESHNKFISKFSLNFVLLSDIEHKVMEKYGAWGEKSMYGKKYMGVIRSTFLIDEKGVLMKAWPKVSVKGHVEKVLKEL